eukprot:CAMPEP_0198728674 /NCGR_PEP_ID=MMETSP1475-20131203/10860_1 /TAXON_ID= ORGANISM="Unidentified sp., Strain CCMP1999" /NCGR_SAMPLE_ID=MMETSP1475 /ASSEMBLY_ACC=CAM_ASM_001111 /LENGTH=93 /DNA_ID=CAMNT_0044491111 /DNA_START=192 /DNA_END=470 /DNA_ORIENTATION=-
MVISTGNETRNGAASSSDFVFLIQNLITSLGSSTSASLTNRSSPARLSNIGASSASIRARVSRSDMPTRSRHAFLTAQLLALPAFSSTLTPHP